jgi:hypothetical protein
MMILATGQAGRPGSVEAYNFRAVDCQKPAMVIIGYAHPTDCHDKSSDSQTYTSETFNVLQATEYTSRTRPGAAPYRRPPCGYAVGFGRIQTF